MKFYYQSELDNLDNETIKAVEAYTEIFFADWFLYKRAEEFESLTDDTLKVYFLEELADQLDLVDFNLTDIQEIILAYMFVNDLFSKEYTDGVMELLDKVLV